jgi:hypothetical protein
MAATVESPFFDEIGVSTVVWLDDLFDAPSAPTSADIAAAVGAAIAGGTLVTHHLLGDLTEDDSALEWTNQIQKRLSVEQIREFLSQISPPAAESEHATADYSPSEVDIIVATLGGGIQQVGLDRWPQVRDQLIQASAGSVFLVDRERVVDGTATQVGDEIVRELVERCSSDALVIVLTHSVGPEGTDSLKQTLASDLNRTGIFGERVS